MKDKDSKILEEAYIKIYEEYGGTYAGTIIFPKTGQSFDVSAKAIHGDYDVTAEYTAEIGDEVLTSNDIDDLAEQIKEKLQLGDYYISQ